MPPAPPWTFCWRTSRLRCSSLWRPQFPAHLAPGATLILSGLLRSDVDAITRAYAEVGLTIVARRDEDEWSALRLQR